MDHLQKVQSVTIPERLALPQVVTHWSETLGWMERTRECAQSTPARFAPQTRRRGAAKGAGSGRRPELRRWRRSGLGRGSLQGWRREPRAAAAGPGRLRGRRAKKGGPRTLPSMAPLGRKSRRRATLPRANPAVPSPMAPFTSVFGMGTGVSSPLWPPGKKNGQFGFRDCSAYLKPLKKGQASRRISTGRLSALPRLHPRPIKVVVYDPPSA